MINDLTRRLYAEGWTRENHPENVLWGDWENFGYKWDYLLSLTWATPCRMMISGNSDVGRGLAIADTSFMGVWYCPENNNPLLRCPYNRKHCDNAIAGFPIACCPCRATDAPYDYDNSVEKVEAEITARRHKQYMEVIGGSYCACVVGNNGYEGGLLEVKYDVQACINYGCQNEFCVIRKKTRDLTKVNIFYDIRRTFITRQGFLENTRVEIEKGVKIFKKPIARTDAEIWLKVKKAEYDPLRDKTVIRPSLTREDRRMEHFSKMHRHYPGYEYFEFRYDVENIRIEKREARDLRQDLADVAEGIKVVHASDLEKAAKAQKTEKRKAAREAKEKKLRDIINGTKRRQKEAQGKQLSLFDDM